MTARRPLLIVRIRDGHALSRWLIVKPEEEDPEIWGIVAEAVSRERADKIREDIYRRDKLIIEEGCR